MTKNAKRLVTLVAAMVMVFAMSITAFAAAPAGTHTTTLRSASGAIPPHNNPIVGAEVEYDSDKNETTITLYKDLIVFMGVTGYVEDMTLEGQVGEVLETTTYTDGETEYPTKVQYTLKGNYSSLPQSFDIAYDVVYITNSGQHRSTTGTLTIESTVNE